MQVLQITSTETLADFRRIRQEQDKEYTEALAIDEAKVHSDMCISVNKVD